MPVANNKSILGGGMGGAFTAFEPRAGNQFPKVWMRVEDGVGAALDEETLLMHGLDHAADPIRCFEHGAVHSVFF